MIEIIWHSNDDFQTFNINHRAFVCKFVAIANVQLRSIWGYIIKKKLYCRIYNKGGFKAIAKTNNVRQTPIRMHREPTVTHRNAWERTGVHRSGRERRYNVRQRPLRVINKITNEYALNLCCCCCWFSLFCAVSTDIV